MSEEKATARWMADVPPGTETSTDFETGKIWVTNKDTKMAPMEFDRIAVHRDKLMFLSCVGDRGRLKQMRAILNNATKSTVIEANGPRLYRPTDLRKFPQQYWRGHQCGRMYADSDGYILEVHHLDYGLTHATFVAKDKGFMLVMSKLALLRKIKRDSAEDPITTPFIPEWLDFVEEKLREQDLLEECYGHRCECGMFSASSDGLNRIIENGLKDGKITIPPPPDVSGRMPGRIIFAGAKI